MFNPFSYLFHWVAARLGRRRLIATERGHRIADLAWPRSMTMFFRYSQRTADAAMVGLSIGPTAIAGMAFATLYWKLGGGFSGGLVGGTISQVSQRFGAGTHDRLDLAVKQSVIVGLAISIPFVLVFWFATEPLISLFSDDAATVAYGVTYLRVQAVGLVFLSMNLISSRTLAGADDTWVAMTVRATGAAVNIVLNAVFIFGLGMGVAGAALGTAMAEGLVTLLFAVGFLRGGIPLVGAFPVQLSAAPPYFDRRLTAELLEMSAPLMVRSTARSIARFPLFAMLAVFGPTVVAAFEVARRVRSMMNASGRGFSMAASSLVGQELGRGDETEANNYADDLFRFSTVIYVLTGAFVFVFAQQIATLFVSGAAVSEFVPFVRIAAISGVGLGVNESFTGILKAAGDNRWAMYSQFIGKYAALLPITYLGLVTPLGILAVYLALIAETWSAALVTGYRFFSGIWKEVSRTYRPEAADD